MAKYVYCEDTVNWIKLENLNKLTSNREGSVGRIHHRISTINTLFIFNICKSI